MDELPGEILHEIASADPAAYAGLVIAYPRFARMINVWKRIDYMILAGVDCRVYRGHRYISSSTHWTMRGNIHSVCGPAVANSRGGKMWYKHGRLHRIDGPAVEYPHGIRKWYIDGVLQKREGPTYTGDCEYVWMDNGYRRHREDGPAFIDEVHGVKKWYLDDKLHRIDGPAVKHRDGTKLWYLNNLLHRIDGPAVILPGGIRQWWQGGQLHRIGGPAIENPAARRKKRWYVRGQRYTRTDYEQKYGCL